MANDKSFKFTVSRSGEESKQYIRKEGDLTFQERDLLLGELIKKWVDSPTIVQDKFYDYLKRLEENETKR